MVTCAGAWLVPMLLSPPLFTRDVYAYLAQGALALHGVDPYTAGPEVLSGPITDNVDGLWQTTGSPYGPLFLLLAKGSSRSPGTESSAMRWSCCQDWRS